MARRGKGQFQFTVVELTALGLSFTVTSGLVFLLGVYVGREAASHHRPPDERVANPPEIQVEKPVPSPPAPVIPIPKRRAETFVPPVEEPTVKARPKPEKVLPPVGEPKEGVAYTVQVVGTKNRREAESLVAKLKGQGYGAFVKAADDGNGRYYRVRIGHFDDLSSARSMAERCRKNLGLKEAYVLSY